MPVGTKLGSYALPKPLALHGGGRFHLHESRLPPYLIYQQKKEQERKDRTKRLIERGVILESLVPGAAAFSNEQIKAFLEKTVRNDFARKILAGMAPQSDVLDASQPSGPPPQSGAKARGKSASTEQGAAQGQGT